MAHQQIQSREPARREALEQCSLCPQGANMHSGIVCWAQSVWDCHSPGFRHPGIQCVGCPFDPDRALGIQMKRMGQCCDATDANQEGS